MLSLLLIPPLASLVFAQILSLRPQDPPSNALVERTSTHPQYRYPPPQPDANLLEDLDLLDIVLLASVDGKFHALNRTSGQFLWSMAPFSSSSSPSSPSSPSTSGLAALNPLVRTSHIEYDPEITDDSAQQEVYIIEPQSGDIYVMPNPSSPLQRFPFTMQELVDMSPFSFTGDEDRRIFVGRKETSLLVVELETGKIKATLNSECPWDQFEEFRDDNELDLDELEGSKPQKAPPTEVYIGRTDYHVSILTRPFNSDSSSSSVNSNSRTIQNLSFSTYGPNKQDNHLQTLYRRTKDNAYVQSLPDGEVISFKAKPAHDSSVVQAPNSHLLWGQTFNQPIVAVFDVLRRKSDGPIGPHPFVLLQPRPTIQDILPNISPSLKENPRTAYVGLVKETGSLFAMSPQRYPLVAFGANSGGIGSKKYKGRLIDSGAVGRVKLEVGGRRNGIGRNREDMDGEDTEMEDEPTTVDEITKLRKLREAAHADDTPELECHDRIMNDRRCLVGVRRLELDEGDGHETRMKRLLDGPASASPYSPGYDPVVGPPYVDPTLGGINDSGKLPVDGKRPLMIDPPKNSSPSDPAGMNSNASVWRIWEAVGAMIVLGLISFWVLSRGEAWRKVISGKQVRLGGVVGGGGESGLKSVKPDMQAQEVKAEEVNGVPNGSVSSLKEEVAPEDLAVAQTDSQAPQPLKRSSSTSTSNDSSSQPSTPSTAVPATPTPPLMVAGGDETDKEDLDGANTEIEDAGAAMVAEATPKKRTRRGKRGAKKPKNVNGEPVQNGNSNGSGSGGKVNGKGGSNNNGKGKEKDKDKEQDTEETQAPPSSLIVTNAPKSVVSPGPSLIVSDTVLGYGSHGTVVYRGSLQGRAVAVKRLLADFVTLASREVSILQESDDHPNVIRYYYQEAHAGFLYIALELCPASLADLIETPDRDAWRDIAVSFDPKRALKQVTNGLRHLHGLKLVHRDIKPQNILVSTKGIGTSGGGGKSGSERGANYRMLISDFGLCKKLDMDQTSFLPTAHGAMAAGTVGWRAPEILRGEVKLDELADDQSVSSRGSVATINGNSSISSTTSSGSNNGKGRTRLTKSVDIFALGCLYYYTLTGGGHPFGDRYEREVNIMKNAKNLELLERFGEEGTEAVDLIEKMLDPVPSERPDTTSCLLHPFFWDSSRRLNFLQDASDRFEIMCRDPKDPHLLTLEEGAQAIVGNDWHTRLDKVFIENLGKFRKYDGKSVQDLLRALRNKKHHYQDLPDNVKRHLGPMPEGFLAYFTRRFPKLFLHVHRVVKETGLAEESMFRGYFELPDS